MTGRFDAVLALLGAAAGVGFAVLWFTLGWPAPRVGPAVAVTLVAAGGCAAVWRWGR